METFAKNKIFFISFLILLSFLLIGIYKYYKMYNNDIKNFNIIEEKCEENSALDICKEKVRPMHFDTLTLFYTIFTGDSLYWIQLVSCILVIISAIWEFHKKQKDGFFINCLLRENYKTYLKKEWLNSYKAVLLLPTFALVGFIICYVISGFNMDHSTIVKYYGNYLATFDSKYLSMGFLFVAIYLLNLFLHSIFYVNLGLICCKKSKNIFITILIAFLFFIGTEMVVGVGIGRIIFEMILQFQGVYSSLSLFNIWVYSGPSFIWLMLLMGGMLALISSMALFKTYENQEEVIITSEK